MKNSLVLTQIERFHLLFLQLLMQRLPGNLYALKGGCNLRFFYPSIRYSEDIDFDIKIVAKETLQNKIQKILKSPQLTQTLTIGQLQIEHISAPKQTDATQRWKIRLNANGMPLHTKIEFSRRNLEDGIKTELVRPEILASHRLPPILVPHYTAEAAFCQKIRALAGRSETQARDLFDLYLLDPYVLSLKKDDTVFDRIEEAIVKAKQISFKDFIGQVVAYLEPSYQDHYRQSKIWEELHAKIIQRLEREMEKKS